MAQEEVGVFRQSLLKFMVSLDTNMKSNDQFLLTFLANTLGRSSPGETPDDGFKKPELDEAVPARTEDAAASAVAAAEVVTAAAIEVLLSFLS